MDQRKKRQEFRKSLSEFNDIGKRLRWIRLKKLNLLLTNVAKDTNIPQSSLCDREAGVRTSFWEELVVLAAYYDKIWQEKYSEYNNYPEFNDIEVKRITYEWITLGDNLSSEHYEDLMEKMKESLRQAELKIAQMRLNENQLDIEDYID